MKPLKVYACYNIRQDVRLSSSSGAVFSSLADYVFSKLGIVYGVAMSEDCYSAEFIGVTDEAGLSRLRGSKYLQAKMGNTYKQIKCNLLSGKLVLFTGTGCQVNGLKNFLGKDYENLICVDVICHGTPSPTLWKKYAQYQEEKSNGKLKSINFRCKDDSWIDFGMKEILDVIPENNIRKLYISKDKDSYMQMFLRDYCLRPSCYECVAKTIKQADLTMADFWGIEKAAEEMNDGMGTSLVLVRTEKGRRLFDNISKDMRLKEVSYEDGIRCNPSEYRSCIKPKQRDIFFTDMHSMSFEELEKKYAAPIKVSFLRRVKRKIKSLVKCILRTFLGGGQRVTQTMDYSLCFVFECEREML